MNRDWPSLIHFALTGVADDPYVRLLKERMKSGSQLVRIHLENSGRGPEYVVILSLHRQLSEMRLPHSEAFTNWSLTEGARMADEKAEVERFVLLLHERFEPLIRDLGPDYFESVLVHHLRELGPPRSAATTRRFQAYSANESRAKYQATQRIDDVLTGLAKALGRSLKYDEHTTARILDAALAEWLTRQFNLREGGFFSPR